MWPGKPLARRQSRHSSISTRISHKFQHLQAARLDDSDGLRASHAREAFEELVNGLATFQGINEVLQRHARAGEDGSAAHDFRVGMDDALKIFEVHGGTLPPSLRTRERKFLRGDVSRLDGVALHEDFAVTQEVLKKMNCPQMRLWLDSGHDQ